MPSTVNDASQVSVRAPEPAKNDTKFHVTSESFSEGGAIPMDHVFTGCGGKNVAPQLSWSGAPAETKSFAITCFDPDAPTGSGFWHWVAYDIPAKVTSIKAGEGKGPGGGKCGYTDYGISEYGGPCPPKGDGDHRYIFRVYALDIDEIKGASDKSTGAVLNFMMRGHVLATGTLTGKFGH